MANQTKSASAVLLGGGLAGLGGYALYRNQKERSYTQGQKKGVLDRYGGLIGAVTSGYLGYKLADATGKNKVAGAAVGAGGFLVAQKLGIGKTLAVAALGGAAYLAYKAMPQDKKDAIKNSKYGQMVSKKFESVKHMVDNKGELASSGKKWLKQTASYEIKQGLKSFLGKALGGGPIMNALAQQISTFVGNPIRDVAMEAIGEAKINGKSINDRFEELKNPRLKAVDKMKDSGTLKAYAAEKGVDPDKMYDSLRKSAKDKGYLRDAVGSVLEHRKYLKETGNEKRSLLKEQKKHAPGSAQHNELQKKINDADSKRYGYAKYIMKDASAKKKKDLEGIRYSDSAQEKSMKRQKVSNELADSSSFINKAHQKIDKKLGQIQQSNAKLNTPVVPPVAPSNSAGQSASAQGSQNKQNKNKQNKQKGKPTGGKKQKKPQVI